MTTKILYRVFRFLIVVVATGGDLIRYGTRPAFVLILEISSRYEYKNLIYVSIARCIVSYVSLLAYFVPVKRFRFDIMHVFLYLTEFLLKYFSKSKYMYVKNITCVMKNNKTIYKRGPDVNERK